MLYKNSIDWLIKKINSSQFTQLKKSTPSEKFDLVCEKSFLKIKYLFIVSVLISFYRLKKMKEETACSEDCEFS
jgi:hypothetical protein